MPLSFLHPGVLFGAAAAVIPLVLHLWRRRQARRVPFPDVRFLEDIHRTRARALGIRRWLLLLLRMLVILLAVLAAAGPRWGGLLRHGDGLLVLVDGSGSLQAAVDGETRAAAARRLVDDLLAAAPPAVPVQVVLAAGDGRVLLDDWLPAGVARSVLPRPWPVTEAACDLPRALDLAADLVAAGPARRPRLVLVTDGQRPRAPADSLDAAAGRLRRRGVDRLAVRLVGDPVPDGGVVAVAPLPAVIVPGQPLTVRATVRPARSGQRFWLELAGRRVAEAVAADAGTREVAFPVTAPERPGLYRLVVRTDPDRRPDDDAVPAWLSVRERARVLLLHGGGEDGGGRGGWRFLAAALAPGDSAATPFRVTARRLRGTTPADLAGTDLVVLVDPPRADPALVAALRDHLARGGGLWLLAGRPGMARDLDTAWLPLLGLPAGVSWEAPGRDAADRWTAAAVGHPVAAGLPAAALASLAETRWYRRWRLPEPPEGTAVVWRFAAGGPALVLGRRGAGRYALAPWDPDPGSGELAANPLFPPLAQRLAGFLAAGRRPLPTVPAGRPVVLPLPPGEETADGPSLAVTLDDPAGRRLWRRAAVPAWRAAGAAVPVGTVWRAGFLSLLRGDSVLAAAAVREPAVEVTAPVLDAAGWRALLAPAGLAVSVRADGAVDLAGRDLAPWFWLLAVAALVAETAVGRGDPDAA